MMGLFNNSGETKEEKKARKQQKPRQNRQKRILQLSVNSEWKI
jgi:hypothetical protein